MANRDKLSTDAAAVFLGVSSKTLGRWRQLGKGPRYLRLGGKVLYPKGELDRWLAGCLQSTDDAPAARVLG